MRKPSSALALALLALATRADAVSTRAWTTATYKEFDEGEAKEAHISSLGEVSPGLFAVRIGLSRATAGDDAGQLINMLFGNTSLQDDVVSELLVKHVGHRVCIGDDRGGTLVRVAVEEQPRIRTLGLELQVIFNKGAVMVLPTGVSKATGFAAALRMSSIFRCLAGSAWASGSSRIATAGSRCANRPPTARRISKLSCSMVPYL